MRLLLVAIVAIPQQIRHRLVRLLHHPHISLWHLKIRVQAPMYGKLILSVGHKI